MITNLLHGFTLAIATPQAVGWLIAGTLLGLFVGAIPGLSGAVILSVVLVFVFDLNLQATLVFFLAIHAAGYFSASISSILLSTPAHAEAVPVALDGHPMAARGEAGRAIGLSAMSTAVGALIGFVALSALFLVVTKITLLFHPPEYIALIVLAMILIGTLGTKRISKALVSMSLGILISTVGTSTVTGVARFTLGSYQLQSGIPLTVITIGIFALPQMIMVFGTASNVASQDMLGRDIPTDRAVALTSHSYRQVLGGLAETFRHPRLLLQSSAIGIICGIVPGIGGFASNYLSYGAAQQTSRQRRHLFGTGVPDGVIAAEAANIPKEQGGLLTTFGLGLPHGTASALFLVALVIKGLQPGIDFPTAHPDVVYASLWIILLSGLVGTALGVVSSPVMIRATRIPGPLLLPFVVSLAGVGLYIGYRSFFTLGEAVVFALVGFLLRRLGYSLASLVVGVVLGSILETNIFLTRSIYPGWSALTTRPIADVIFALALLVLVIAAITMRRSRAGAKTRRQPVLELITSLALAAIGAWAFFYARATYNFDTGILAEVVAAVLALSAAFQVPGDVRACVRAASGRTDEPTVPGPGRAETAGDMRGQPPARKHPGPSTATGDPAPAPSTTVTAVSTVAPGAVPEERAGARGVRARSWGRAGQYTREVAALIWIVAAFTLCAAFGFHVGVPAFAFLYGLAALGKSLTTWRARGVFAVVAAAALLFITSLLFHAVGVVESPWIAAFGGLGT